MASGDFLIGYSTDGWSYRWIYYSKGEEGWGFGFLCPGGIGGCGDYANYLPDNKRKLRRCIYELRLLYGSCNFFSFLRIKRKEAQKT